MIREITQRFPKSKTKNKVTINGYRPKIIRYADDFVVFHKELEVILQCKTLISQWLDKVGLTLRPEKTRICHTLNEIYIDGNPSKPGFDFLGFKIRSYPVGKHQSGRTGGRNSEILGFKTIIKASEKAVKAHHQVVKQIIKDHKTAPQVALISRLNPIICGWCNYYSTVVSKEIFSSEDAHLWKLLRAWTASRTGKANYQKLSKYFSNGRHGTWTFQTHEDGGFVLMKHSDTPIIRHTLVRPEASPYDGE
ncbi:MAG: hypothetical protein N5P05_002376 [Chroococcopsis gigantea SAG 12.99]|nr:hypothetical protein [Chroococcopsis gigantea SAG 12.99]